MNDEVRFCLDTNVFIEAWTKHYAPNLAPTYWEQLDALAREGMIFSPIEVRREIEVIDDELWDWVRNRDYLFRDISDPIQENVRQILAAYPTLVDNTRQRSIADPWVIATAMAETAIVVTKEVGVGLGSRRLKIPDVCDALGIACINEFEFIRQVGITFDVNRLR